MSAHLVRAGTYVWSDSTSGTKSPTYSGGTSAGNCIYGPFSRSYASGAGDGTYYGDGNSNEYIYSPPGQLSHQSCTGPISTTFTWNADNSHDLPSKSVIVEQNCIAGGRVDAGGSFSCDDGLGQSGSASVSGTKYSAVNDPGPGFSLPNCNPSASFNHTNSTTANGGSAYVNYKATASPVLLNLTGITVDSSGGDNILIGQHCGASLTGIPGGTGWAVSYQWSVSGDTFQYWSSDTPTPYDPNASYYVDGPGPLTNPTAGWYWHDIGNGSSKTETVSCTVTITPPSGAGSTFTVSATKTVTVWVPIWTTTGTGGTMRVDPAAPSSTGGDYWLWAGPIIGSGAVGGMGWLCTVLE